MPKRKITRVDFVPKIQQLGKAGATKLRVAAYARVSSESEEQEHSLSAQTDYFEAFIKENPLWEYVGLYVDDGVSGLSHQRREGFNRMVADALDGKIDLIITKSLSRFARNTVDALTTIRKLKAANVGIFFQKEDINTLDAKGEFSTAAIVVSKRIYTVSCYHKLNFQCAKTLSSDNLKACTAI